jgi:polyvinyl alcohol dehydrogenase (cytochrome)
MSSGKKSVWVMGALQFALSALVGSSASAGATGNGHLDAASRPEASLVPAVTVSDWTTFDQNSLRTGVDSSGNSFSPASAAWISPALHGQLYGQPLVYGGRVFAATENDTVYALAADTGQVLWSTHLATPVTASNLPCGNISPTVGITGTPVIDTDRSEIFVVADEAAKRVASHHLIGLNLYTGAVVLDKVVDPPGSDPAAQLQRASLALDEGNVIIGMGGNYGDCSTYHGLVISAPEGGGTPNTYVVANQAGDNQGAVWMGGAAPSVDAQGDVWVATGNSAHGSSSDTYDEGDSVLRLSPSMQLLSSFAPRTWYNDNATDADLGSTAPALLPNKLVFQVGKANGSNAPVAYVLHESALGGVGGQLASGPFCEPGVDADGGSADLNGTLFVPCQNGVTSVTVTTSTPSPNWTTTSGAHGSPIVAGGLVWSIGNGNLYALNPNTGATVQSFSIGSSSSSFPSPSAADGLVLAPAGTRIHAFEGPGGLPGPPPAITTFNPTSGPVGTVVTIKGTNLTGAKQVTFKGVTGTITKDTATTIKVIVPERAATGKIEVVTPDGTLGTATSFKVT